MSYPEERMKSVFTIVEAKEGAQKRWVRIGIGFVNRDDSINVRLDAVPVNGRIHIRDYQRLEREGANIGALADAPPHRAEVDPGRLLGGMSDLKEGGFLP
jgi:hypothetical protein